MELIKKYANRKLYHTNRKRYITLDGIARLIQNGEQVAVRDNETGEDITASILSQVVVQHGEQSDRALPTNLLMSLIQLGGGAFARIRSGIYAYFAGNDQIASEVERRLAYLVHDQSLSTEDATRIRQLLLRSDVAQAADEPPTPADDSDEAFASYQDIRQLQGQLDALADAVEELYRQRASQSAAARATPDTPLLSQEQIPEL